MTRLLIRVVLSAAACVGIGALTIVPSQAAAPTTSAASTPATVRTAPAATALVSAAAHTPTISPAVTTEHVAVGAHYNCAPGNLCTVVWDPTTSSYKIFFLYHCNLYHVSYWTGDGGYSDQQTGSPTSYFYGQSGNTINHFKPDYEYDHTQDWDPVYSIRNCT